MSLADLPPWHSALLLAPAVAAGAAALRASRAPTPARAWRGARAAGAAMLAAAIAAALVRALSESRADALWRADTVSASMLVLVSFVAWIVIRFSEGYLAGDAHERRYVVQLLGALAAIAVVVVANNVAVLALAWASVSFAMHDLLRFFRDRPVAIAVAHKKFLLARVADACMVGAVALFSSAFGTLRIDRIVADAATRESLPAAARAGVVLIAIAAILKSAQLPFHGWLIQVMEAPTPVSALLHAGVVNFGGFVLLLFAPLVDRTIEARVLLVAAGTTTAVVAALVMTTRISVKVSLAWSTCAQMGFMLMQCGLGAWEMALLHLLAHSLYKAHAFLSAGGAVRRTQLRQLAPLRPRPRAVSVALAAAGALAATAAIGWAWGQLPFTKSPTATVWLLTGIVALALVPLAGVARPHPGSRVHTKMAFTAVAITVVYLALHDLFARLVSPGAPAPDVLLVAVAASFALLFIAQALCTVAPEARLVQRLYPWVYGGFFIDESFTRAAFALRKPPLPSSDSSSALPRPAATPLAAPASPPGEFARPPARTPVAIGGRR